MKKLSCSIYKSLSLILFPLYVAIFSVAGVSCSGADCSDITTDILIVGGGASGTAAGVQAARMGVDVLIAEETPWLGGMLTAAGVSAVDGNYRMPAGFFGEFRAKLENYYGGPDSINTGWVSNILFEPSVGDRMFKELAAAEENLTIVYNVKVSDIKHKKDGWHAVLKYDDGRRQTVTARILIDGTELGDVAAAVGVSYDLGMESRHVTHEDIAPEEAVNIVQDLTMVAILKDYGRDVTIDEPDDYDPDEFACTCVNEHCVTPKEPNRMWQPEQLITYGKLPNNKYMINWPIEGNDFYVNLVEMTPAQREEAIAEAKAHTMRYIYFLQKELGFNTLGLADDEFPTDDLLPFIPYHRESRRIHGKVRFDVNHIMDPYATAQPLYRTTIAVGDYPVDHHHMAYSGAETLPNLYFHSVPSYGLPMGTLIPRDVEDLLVTEKSISVSNIVNGSTRLQPVVTQLGQAAGAIAAIAVRDSIPVSSVDVRDVQTEILNAGGYLLPYLDVVKTDPRFAAYQRIGATGILRSVGMTVDWSNQTWLRADEPLMLAELADFYAFYGIDAPAILAERPVTLGEAASLVATVSGDDVDAAAILLPYGVEKKDIDDITRGEFALIVDEALNPFGRKVAIDGTFVND